jgi:hypothetical protein
VCKDLCAAECGSNWCAGGKGTAECEQCNKQAAAGECGRITHEACTNDPDCVALDACVIACPEN